MKFLYGIGVDYCIGSYLVKSRVQKNAQGQLLINRTRKKNIWLVVIIEETNSPTDYWIS